MIIEQLICRIQGKENKLTGIFVLHPRLSADSEGFDPLYNVQFLPNVIRKGAELLSLCTSSYLFLIV